MEKTLKIAVAQINCTVGDLDGNARRIAEAVVAAREAGADIVVTPELALCGYPPEDLLLRPDFYRACAFALEDLADRVRDVVLVVGHPLAADGRFYNAASVVRDGRVVGTYRKMRLPNYQVFDEKRYFDAGEDALVFSVGAVRCGVSICADVWDSWPVEAVRRAGADLLISLNASPYHVGKSRERELVLADRVRESGLAVLYVNMVGGQDELVFDGYSMALDNDGACTYRAPAFEESLDVVDWSAGRWLGGRCEAPLVEEAEVYSALVGGVRDYIGKNGFPGAIIGLSGGIDSALTLCVAADALGAERVRAIMMASPYTAQMSLDDSRALVAALGVQYDEIPIEPAMAVYDRMLEPYFAGLPADTTEENLQSRIRGNLLMAFSNKTGRLVLTTGNKSEMATGYATLYGDMAGGFGVLRDIYKTLVYRLARWRNTITPVIPENIITRPPSAELKPDQIDQDSLPPYEVLDAIIEAYMEQDLSPREIIERGYREEDVRRAVSMLRRNEYKRRQAPVGIRVTERGFGKDWRYPITSRYRDEY
ncbi:MAG: NAD+ synthase [Rhodocyclaceae bacterium]|nr:NAD+ synthase [Rhodocyclaceae bacterium]